LTQDFFVHLLEKGALGGSTRSVAGSAASCSARWTISWPMPPNALAPPNVAAAANGYF